MNVERIVTDSRNSSLDGLRGFSAIYVVIFHILHQPKYFNDFTELGKSIVLAGASMVQVFFVISGFFISRSIYSLVDSSSRPGLSFIIKRFFRIMPLWAALLLAMYIQNQIELKTFFANLVFFFGYMKAGSEWFPIFLSWSLQAEVIFYLIAALSIRKINRISVKTLFVLWVFALILAYAWKKFGYIHFSDGYLPDGFFVAQSMYFISGIFIEKITKHNELIEKLLSRAVVLTLEVVVLVSFIYFNYFDCNYLKIILAPFLVFIVQNRHSILGKIFSTRIFASFGVVSFGIYLLQDISKGHIELWFGGLNMHRELLYSLGLTITAAFCSYIFLEKNAIRIGNNFVEKLKYPKE